MNVRIYMLCNKVYECALFPTCTFHNGQGVGELSHTCSVPAVEFLCSSVLVNKHEIIQGKQRMPRKDKG